MQRCTGLVYGLMQIYNNNKKSEGIFPMEIGVIPIPIDVRSNSLPFPFTIPNWSIVSIPVEFQFDSHWESHSHRLISSMVHSRQWWLRRCSSLTDSSNWKSTRRMMWPTHKRETSWETDSTSNSRAWSPWRRYQTHLQNKTSSASADGQPRDALWAELCYLDLLWI